MPKLAIPPFTRRHVVSRVAGEDLGEYSNANLGDAGGLTQFGVHLGILHPGGNSSMRHWHEAEDELVYVLAGELTLVEDDGTTPLRAGDSAAWKAGDADGPPAREPRRRRRQLSSSSAPRRRAGTASTTATHDLIQTFDGPRRTWTRADGTVVADTGARRRITKKLARSAVTENCTRVSALPRTPCRSSPPTPTPTASPPSPGTCPASR